MNISGTYKTQHGDLTVAQNGDNVTATYQENGVCSGKLTGSVVEGIWKNKKDQGLFEWKFDDKGNFTGKYKSGFEKGPMRGKWNGLSIQNVSNSSENISLSLETTINEIHKYLDILVYANEEDRLSFVNKIQSFINVNNEYYWWIPAIKVHIRNWEIKIDHEGFDASISGLNIKGETLDFNPYDYFRLYFNTREYLFSIDEDDDEPNSFFEAIMYMDGAFNDPQELVEVINDANQNGYYKFINKCKTVLYCTICKACEEGIDSDDLSELLLGVNFYEKLSDINDEIYGGDLSNEIQEDVLISLNINRKDFDDESNLWRDQFVTNWSEVAQEIIDNDVFDNDIIS